MPAGIAVCVTWRYSRMVQQKSETMLRHLIKSFRNQLVLSAVETILQHSRTSSPAPEAGGVEIVHSLPGRVRLRSGIIKNQQPIADSLHDTLNMVEGITAAAVDWRTGSVLIHYENGTLRSNQLQAAVERLLEDEQETSAGTINGGKYAAQRAVTASLFSMVSAQPLLFGSLALILLAGLIADSRKDPESGKQSNE